MIEQRWWDRLSKKEATAILDEHVAGHPARVQAALAEFVSYGIAPDELDFSRRSLERIWPVVLAHYGSIPEHPDPLVEGGTGAVLGAVPGVVRGGARTAPVLDDQPRRRLLHRVRPATRAGKLMGNRA